VDYDADGDLDLIVGNIEGNYFLFRGEGKGNFSPVSEAIMQGDQALNTGPHGDPFFVDWDGDGDLDLIAGSTAGGVMMAKNTAGKGQEMSFAKPQALIPALEKIGPRFADEPLRPSDSTRVCVDDLNGDGKLDLIVGDKLTLRRFAEGIQRAEGEKELAKLDQQIDEIRRSYQEKLSEEEMQKRTKALQESSRARAKLVTVKWTGHVWVYLQK